MEHNQLLDYILECNRTEGQEHPTAMTDKAGKKALLWGEGCIWYSYFKITLLNSLLYNELQPITSHEYWYKEQSNCSTFALLIEWSIIQINYSPYQAPKVLVIVPAPDNTHEATKRPNPVRILNC